MAEYKYTQLQSVAVGMVEETVTLNMKMMGQGEQNSFSFETDQKEDIASLIASYSPAHSNWQRVGEAKTKMVCLVKKDCLLPKSSFVDHHCCGCVGSSNRGRESNTVARSMGLSKSIVS